MAEANSSVQLVGTDFNEIKNNLILYLQSQNILKDANYTGSVLSLLMDVLAYNTHYNAFYLNMVANEMFLDTAVKRGSLISHAKKLGYLPSSYACSTAYVDIDITGLDTNIRSFTIPKYTKFVAKSDSNDNYTFVNIEEIFTRNDTGSISIKSLMLKQGEPVSYSFNYNTSTNEFAKFTIPDTNIDIDTLEVQIQTSTTDVNRVVYQRYDDVLTLDPTSEVYFIQESLDGKYEIYFGNDVLGKALQNGNVILVRYLASDGSVPNGIDKFYLLENPLASYSSFKITVTQPSFLGREKESIESIRYSAPKVYSAQGRAVTKNDYIALIKKNANKFPVEAVNVWSGEENDPPVYGKVFVSVKPVSGYTITENQKKIIREDILKPMSLMTVTPEVVDVDYTFLKLNVDVLLDKKKTLISDDNIRSDITQVIKNYASENLNQFDSTLVIPDLSARINAVNRAIITNSEKIYLQKKIIPTLNTPLTYIADFGIPIERGIFGQSVSISPSVRHRDFLNNIKDEVYIEESPATVTRLQEIVMINEGYGYTDIPTVEIVGDGSGATAKAIVSSGKVKSIVLTNRGSGYTTAKVVIYGGGGILASAKVILEGQYNTLRSYYFVNGIKTILNGNAGTVDYLNGIVTITNFYPYDVNNVSKVLSINVIPDTPIIYSIKNKLLTLDPEDTTAITINILSK